MAPKCTHILHIKPQFEPGSGIRNAFVENLEEISLFSARNPVVFPGSAWLFIEIDYKLPVRCQRKLSLLWPYFAHLHVYRLVWPRVQLGVIGEGSLPHRPNPEMQA